MSRNGSGTYSLPAGNPVVTGTTIASTWANTTLSDIATEITNSLPRDGQAGPTGPYNWNAQNLTNVGVFGAISATFTGNISAAAGTFSGTLTAQAALNEAKGADIASAATTDIGAATGSYVNVTGTTTITALGTVQAGTRRIVRFAGALTLTHNATSLILPGAANIVTAANDVAVFVSEGSGNWRCVSYLPATGQAVTASGTSRALGVDCKNNATTPNSKFDLLAAEWTVRSSAGNVVTRWNQATVTVDTGLAGPAANGRDQAGAFSASTWLHFYYIYGSGQTDAGIVSTSAPPTGPVLPTNYTHWAYAGAVRFDAGSLLVKTRIKGDTAYYEAAIGVLNSGSATIETAISLTAAVPPNALTVITKARAQYSDTSANVTMTLAFRYVSGTTYADMNVASPAASVNIWNDSEIHFPNLSQNLYYLWNAATGTRNASMSVLGYVLPNGS